MNDIVVATPRIVEAANGGGLEGASRHQRETALWSPHMGSPDQIINRVKALADARGRDIAQNDGYVAGGIGIAKDSIVGASYKLNSTPVLKVLQQISKGFDEKWAEEFQEVHEARWELLADSEECWLDASGVNTFTEMVRLVVGGDMITGEILATAEWLSRDASRPLSTAIQMIAPSRLSNPEGMPDDRFLRRGVQKNARGAPIGYHIRVSHPGEYYEPNAFQWRYIQARKPWGRRQVIHLFEQQEAGQTRGIADIVSVLKNMRMTKQFDELTLQQAVVDASYAAALETELPPDVVFGTMGGNTGAENFQNGLGVYLELLQKYFSSANNIAIDGVKMPVLPPGVKMSAKNLGTPGGIGTDFGKSLLRHSAAGLGLSAEEFMNNFSDANYSGLKGSFAFTEKRMKSRKKRTADRYADAVHALVLEEEIGNGYLPLPRGVSPDFFYEPLMKAAICKSAWIGAGSGQIDELKETQAAMLRIKSGLSTYEIEIAKLGGDWRDRFKQRAREEGLIGELELEFGLDAQKAGQKEPQNQLAQDGKKDQ